MSTHEFIQLYERMASASKPSAATIAAAANAQPSGGTKRALLFGLNYFGTASELRGCHNDIIAATSWLKSCGFTEFTILMDSPDDKEFKKPDCPTRANMIKEMKALMARCKPSDFALVWYSGHGGHIDDQKAGGSDERDGQDETLVPVDYAKIGAYDADEGCIRDDDLKKILVDGLPEGVKLRVVFDCCHSGSSLDLPYSWISNTRTVQENNSVVNKDIVYLSGCQDSQTSADAIIDRKPSGALSWALLKSLSDIRLSGSRAAKWTWKELTQDVRSRLRTGRYEQIPILGVSHKGMIDAPVDLL